jgi:hypothetical protein
VKINMFKKNFAFIMVWHMLNEKEYMKFFVVWWMKFVPQWIPGTIIVHNLELAVSWIQMWPHIVFEFYAIIIYRRNHKFICSQIVG